MFSIYHIIWIAICVLLIVCSLIYIQKKQLNLGQVLHYSCIIGIVSEVVKTFSVFKMVPSSDGTRYYPYFELQYLPLHMCSLLIFVILYCTYGKNEKIKNTLLGFLYPAGLLGGIGAILMPSVFSTVSSPSEAFIRPVFYQTFIYHSMLIVLSICILRDKNSGLTANNFKKTILLVGGLTFVSLYLNSLFAEPVYEGSTLKSVEYTTNFFFTYNTPIGIKLTSIGQWYLYLAIFAIVAVLLVVICYVPFFRKKNSL